MPAPRANAGISARATLVVMALCVVPPAIAMRPVLDLDVWWHLRAGEWIAAHRTLPTTDPFSSFGAGRSWVAYHWLFDVAVHAAHAAAGLAGVAGLTVALGFAVTLALLRLVRRFQPDLFSSSMLTALGLVAMAPLLAQPRPWLVNILLLVLQVTALLDVRRTGDPRPLALLPLLYLVWANVNIQFVYGLFVLGLAALEPVIERLLGIQRDEQLPLRPVLLTFGGCLLATLVGPYHVQVYTPVIEHALLSNPFLYISETQAPRFRALPDWAALGLLLAAVLALGRRRAPSIFVGALLAVGAALFFRSARDVWVCVIASVTVVAMYGPRRMDVPGARIGARRGAVIAAAAAAVSLSIGAARLSGGRLDAAVAARFPVAAAAFVERRGLEGPLYNHLDWGGFLIWRLPALPVSMDGRTALHGDERILRSVATWNGARGWDTDEELTRARVVIGASNAALVSLLRLDPRFQLAYEDDVATVFVRREPRAAGG